MRILNGTEMWNAVTLTEVMDAVEDAYAIHKSGRYTMPDRFCAARGGDLMLYMPCFLDSFIGTKMLAEFPDNPKKGFPYLSGLMILNEAETGQPAAVMDGGTLTAMRTGAVSGVALRYLAPEACTSAGLVGCGTQGLHQLLYACAVRPLTDLYLYDLHVPDPGPFCDRRREKLHACGINRGIRFHFCRDARSLAEQSEILISATQATDPVYPDDEALLKGKCLIAIGSWKPDRRELPDAVWKLCRFAYTELPYACEESGDLAIPLASGLLSPDRVRYMEDLIQDTKEGRPHEQADTRCFKSVGMGIFDARCAQLICEKARQKGIGAEIAWNS